MQKYVNRPEYLDFLKRWQNRQIIKVVSGVRRAGKSTLFYLFRNYLKEHEEVKEEQFISINFENMKYDNLRNAQNLYDYLENKILPDQMNYIFLDEIQHVKEFERVVDSLFLKDNVDIYLTGSNAYFLSSEIATLLTGRYVELKILPLSFSEFVAWHKQNDKFTNNDDMFNKYLESSFPYTLFIDTPKERNEYLQGVYSTIVLTDIVSRLNIKDTPVLERVIQSLYSSIGSQVSINKITNTLKSAGYSSSNKTVDRYLGGILGSLLMYEAKRYDIHSRQLLKSQSKYYGVDIGIRNILLPDHQEDFGHIIENIVYLELLRRNKAVYVGDSSKYEVDFVGISDLNELSYYQVALTTMDEKVLKRELRSLEQIRDSYPKYLLTLDTINRTANYNGIQKLNLIDWLLS
ncbi:ATP-binding protein [Lactobacillus johnsonii]|uniref:ATP-binding protein n=1 Tax=Lactobacillus johnsonii TaxID=33959 RepID=UPI002A9C03A2|nr:ATP-binding protein [Lactobacillus johnsonii]MDY5351863.1 ATP-binding protein [Lactobacillus johnsonii]MDY5419989.1 ATP-binding protein [Lactobacillus johnsonii]